MQEFFVANYRVDILRNQIVREGQVIALEPKVLEVLKVLAEHSGEVVSHQVLHDTVWPDIVVAPNALQRCIGQLRKALNDDGKAQRVIVTHPKKGYSLVAPVSIRTDTPTPNDTTATATLYSTQNQLTTKIGPFSAAILLAIVVLFFTFQSKPTDPPKLQKFTQLKPLTATDESEFYSTFSPDGRYVAFSRNVPGPGGHMWLIDRNTGQETQLTQISGRYGQPNWSSDGKQLAFLQLGANDEPKSGRCVNINLLYVPLALKEPQPSKTLLSCKTIPLQGLQWINDKNLIAIVSNYFDGNTRSESSNLLNSQLIRINSQTGDVQSLFQNRTAPMYALSWSDSKQQLAIMQKQPQKTPSVLLFSPETLATTPQVFTPPKRYSSDTRWYPIWHPNGEHLLFSAASRLYLMDLDGNLESQVIPTFQDISRPMFHPDGSSIAMTLGKVDRDIAELRLIEGQDGSHEKTLYNESPIARSILRENDAQYQPGGNNIAFFSQRSGTRQLWLTDEDSAKKTVRQLIQLDDLYPEYFVWSPNGQQLAISTQRMLFLTDLQGNTDNIELPFNAIRLYQWTSDNQLLMQIADTDVFANGEHVGNGDEQRTRLVRYDISQNSYDTEYLGQTSWAQYRSLSNQQTEIWFLDNEHRLKRIEKNGPKTFHKTAQIKTGSRFFIKDQQLYFFSDDKHFWKLPLSANQANTELLQTPSFRTESRQTVGLKNLYHYPGSNIRFTDVSGNGAKFLVSKQMSSKKEIVLLTP